MIVLIKKDALDVLFRVILSCQCPLGEKEEGAVFDQLRQLKDGESLEYNQLLDIFSPNANTVIHRLHQFSLWSVPAAEDKFTVEREHVLRHFASSYHWYHVVGQGMANSYRKVVSVPNWFVGHMILPIEIEKGADEKVSGIYRFDDNEVKLRNLFLAPEYNNSSAKIWAVHFASVLAPLSSEEVSLVRKLIDSNPVMVEFRRETREIDYLCFERYGDYRDICEKRHAKYYGS